MHGSMNVKFLTPSMHWTSVLFGVMQCCWDSSQHFKGATVIQITTCMALCLLGYDATYSGRSVHALQRSLHCHIPDDSNFITDLAFLASVLFGSGEGVHF
jgi:hypothetical protein